MLDHALLYFIPSRGEFLKIQPSTGDNLLREDRALGYTDYVLWSIFKPLDLGIDGELDMECLDSGMVLLKMDPIPSLQDDVGRMLQDDVLAQAYDDKDVASILLIAE